MTAIATANAIPALHGYTREQVELIKRQIAVGATDDELAMFIHFCHARGFDPMDKDVFFVKRKNKDGSFGTAYQTSIDAMRSRAEDTGKYAGNDRPVFDFDAQGNPVSALVTVWKMVEGVRCPFEGEAHWNEFYPGDAQGFMWRKMPRTMLGKCAEAQALRRAFPKQLKKIYVKEEMEQAQGEIVQAQPIDTTAKLKALSDSKPEAVVVAPEHIDPPVDDTYEDIGYVHGEASPGDFVIPMGKYKGMRVKDVAPDDLRSYMAFFKNPNGPAADLIRKANEYFGGQTA